MPGLSLPPFPDDVQTHPLLIVDYELIKAEDVGECQKLWKAATALGFWYLKNHGTEELVEGMFDMGEETMKLPMEEKMKFEQGDDGRSFGYKAAGANATDEYGNLDTVEFINVSRDDALAFPKAAHRTYPPTVEARMPGTVTPFVKASMEITRVLVDCLGRTMGLPRGALDEIHSAAEYSGSETRVIKNPPVGEKGVTKDKIAIGAHTDFGSLSFLHNKLGGLQVLVPGTDDWQFIKPMPRHAICNIGDALKILSGGLLVSNMHRVIPPPGQQSAHTRWSLVYFSRPGNTVLLEPFSASSSMIANAVEEMADEDKKRFYTGSTAGDWFKRRIKYQRIKNREGPESWRASRGTEHAPTKI